MPQQPDIILYVEPTHFTNDSHYIQQDKAPKKHEPSAIYVAVVVVILIGLGGGLMAS